jgi:hypothetical protein
LTGVLAFGAASPSFAFGGQAYYYDQDDNGSSWSFYPGYYSQQDTQRYGSGARSSYAYSPRVSTHAARHHPVERNVER